MTTVVDTTPGQLDLAIAAAAVAAEPLADLPLGQRAALLHAAADALDAATEQLVPLAVEESGLPEGRLRGELLRTTGQLRLFAEVLGEGSYLEATIDTADANAMPVPRPDLRRVLVAIGPVLVFAASNFPFAFSVAGGDTASALAAGCPVVLKAHPDHPRLSSAVGDIVAEALAGAGAPPGTFAVVHGLRTGTDALSDARIKAASFTGSIPGGRALFDIANARPEPIPFYGEMGSLNPAFVTPGAVSARGEQIADGYAASFSLGVGQFCTKPGLLFLPSGHGLEERLAAAVGATPAARMLSERIHSGYTKELARLSAIDGVRVVASAEGEAAELHAGPTLLATTLQNLLANEEELLVECFGPTSIIVEYGEDVAKLSTAAEALRGNLTATVHAEDFEYEAVQPLLRRLRDRAGRLIWNNWPTGVAVSWAMHHGGPYPATTVPLHTSVGATAIRRFLRPVCYQDTPAALLPEVLHDRNVLGIPRRLNGVLTLADVAS